MTRLTFFRKLAQAAAIVALAPQLAFRTPVKAIAPPEPDYVWEVVYSVWDNGKLKELSRRTIGTQEFWEECV